MPAFVKCSAMPATLALIAIAMASPVAAQSVQAESAVSRDIDIPSTTVADAIARLRTQTGVEIGVAIDATGTTQAVKGRMTVRQAVERMLRGSNLRATGGDTDIRIVADEAVAIDTSGGETQLGTVRVSAAADGSGAGGTGGQVPIGANGSSDPTATEGSLGYTTTKSNVGAKIATISKDIPQTVTVVSRQRIIDQQLTTLTEVLEQTPGITVLQPDGSSQFQPGYYSRGFAIQNFQIDGGAAINYGVGLRGDTGNYSSGVTPIFDMSLYDHVEVLRGADGLFSGVGDPGGTLSLQRKRPVPEMQLLVEASGGSWNKLRLSVDASVPLTTDDKLRVRLVATHDQSDFFYRAADKKLDTLYANFEFRPSTKTRLNIGASYTEQHGVPWSFGMPRYRDGGDLNLPRNTCLCLSFGDYATRQLEVFAQAEHHFDDKWSLNVNLSTLQQKSRILDGELSTNGVDRATNLLAFGGGYVLAGRSSRRSVQYIADVFVTGGFRLFGQDQHIVIGGNYQKQDDRSNPQPGDGSAFLGTVATLSDFDPNGYDLPSDASFDPIPVTVPVYERIQYAAYATLRLTPLPRVHVNAGLRYNHYETSQTTVYSYPGSDTFSQNKIFSEGRFVPPLLSLSYDLTSKMTAYASYAGIYVSQADRRTSDGSVLKPATGRNIELGIKRADFDGRLNSSIALYDIVQKNLAVRLPFDPLNLPTSDPATGINCCYSPIGSRNTSRGFDIELSGALTPRWQISAGYTHNVNKFDPSALQASRGTTATPLISQAPKDLVKLFTSYRLGTTGWLGKTTLGGGGRFQTEAATFYLAYDSSTNTSTPASIVQPSYALLDLFARFTLARGITAQVNVNNVFDKRYYATIGSVSSGNFYGEPRNGSVTLRAKF